MVEMRNVNAEHRVEELLFFKRWLANPLKVGALLPSSSHLARLVARHTRRRDDEVVIELGAGTGVVTKALLESGIPTDRLFVVELDGDLCRFLRRAMPHAQVIQGDATRLAELLPKSTLGRVSTVISGIPMVTLPLEIQRRMIDSWFAVMGVDGYMLQYTYSLMSPIPEADHGLVGKRCGVAVRNLPPAWVWRYTRAGTGPHAN
jgi:phosphatidylethanolamine/phosphatidyl-N-methylethanolamine N-methyltransferase